MNKNEICFCLFSGYIFWPGKYKSETHGCHDNHYYFGIDREMLLKELVEPECVKGKKCGNYSSHAHGMHE